MNGQKGGTGRIGRGPVKWADKRCVGRKSRSRTNAEAGSPARTATKFEQRGREAERPQAVLGGGHDPARFGTSRTDRAVASTPGGITTTIADAPV